MFFYFILKTTVVSKIVEKMLRNRSLYCNGTRNNGLNFLVKIKPSPDTIHITIIILCFSEPFLTGGQPDDSRILVIEVRSIVHFVVQMYKIYLIMQILVLFRRDPICES
jgi:hypothetical protein